MQTDPSAHCDKKKLSQKFAYFYIIKYSRLYINQTFGRSMTEINEIIKLESRRDTTYEDFNESQPNSNYNYLFKYCVISGTGIEIYALVLYKILNSINNVEIHPSGKKIWCRSRHNNGCCNKFSSKLIFSICHIFKHIYTWFISISSFLKKLHFDI